jgi:hypothetical protein
MTHHVATPGGKTRRAMIVVRQAGTGPVQLEGLPRLAAEAAGPG